MAILTSEIISDMVQIDGRRQIREAHTFHDGTMRVISYRASAGQDATATMQARVATLEAEMAEAEDGSAPSLVEDGANARDLVATPVHSTSKRLAKVLIRWMLRERDPRIVVLLEPLIVYLRANYTALQLSAFLGMTLAQISTVNDKINSVLDAPAVATSAKDLMAATSGMVEVIDG